MTEHGAASVRLLERVNSPWGGEPLPEERYSDSPLGWRKWLTDLHAAALTGSLTAA